MGVSACALLAVLALAGALRRPAVDAEESSKLSGGALDKGLSGWSGLPGEPHVKRLAPGGDADVGGGTGFHVEAGRGWMAEPPDLFFDARRIRNRCVNAHVGTVEGGATRGNHRHAETHEILVTWGAEHVVVLDGGPRGGVGGRKVVRFGEGEVAAVLLPAGTAHAVLHTGPPGAPALSLLGCADREDGETREATEFGVWDDLDDVLREARAEGAD